MNYKNCILIAVFLMIAVCIAPVVGYSDYVNKYSAPPLEASQDGCGTLYVSLLCHNGIISNEFAIQRVNATGHEFVSGNLVPKEFADLFEKIGEPLTITMPIDGIWDNRFVPGTYLLTLADGNNQKSEYAIVTIGLAETSYVKFIGHGMTPVSNPSPAIVQHEQCIDVTKNVQDVVGRGIHQFRFVFDNSPNPGGIFSTSGYLLSTILDPYYGFVKTAYIQYTEDDHRYTILKAVYGDCDPLMPYEEYRYIGHMEHNHWTVGHNDRWSEWSINKPTNWNQIPHDYRETMDVEVVSGEERTIISL